MSLYICQRRKNRTNHVLFGDGKPAKTGLTPYMSRKSRSETCFIYERVWWRCPTTSSELEQWLPVASKKTPSTKEYAIFRNAIVPVAVLQTTKKTPIRMCSILYLDSGQWLPGYEGHHHHQGLILDPSILERMIRTNILLIFLFTLKLAWIHCEL